MMRRKVARIVQAKSFSNVDMEEVASLLEIIDYIDKKLEQYKKKYLKLKEKALKQIARQQKKMQEEEEQESEESEPEEKAKKKKKEKKKEKKAKKTKKQKKQPATNTVDLLEFGDTPVPQ